MSAPRHVSVNLDHCNGCELCLRGCAQAVAGNFNPRHSKIVLKTDTFGAPVALDFTAGCAATFEVQCESRGSAPACIQACLPGALGFPGHAQRLSLI